MGEARQQGAALALAEEALLLRLTGRKNLADALQWIGEGRRLGAATVHELLGALVAAVEARLPDSQAALRAAGRWALSSGVDTSADLLQTDTILPPAAYDAALAALAACTPTGTLVGMTASTLAAVRAEHPRVVEVLGQVAGLAWRDLRDRAAARGVHLPSASTGPWRMNQLDVVLEIVDEVVRGATPPHIPEAVAARPIELLLGEGPDSGWEQVEQLRIGGVPYGVLLAQREVGGSWGAHRNRTASDISRIITDQLLTELAAAGVTYWSTGGHRSERVPKAFLAKHAARAGRTPGQLTVVTRDGAGAGHLAIFLAVARDGGTARKTGSTLLKVPPQLTIPGAVVLVGGGWADRRESDDLIRAFGGRVYTDQTLHDLVTLAAQRPPVSPGCNDAGWRPIPGSE